MDSIVNLSPGALTGVDFAVLAGGKRPFHRSRKILGLEKLRKP